MKKIFCTFCLIGLMASWATAQLPFEPFVAYPGNPVIPRTAGSWDAGVVIGPSMIFVNDTFYVCYEGVFRDFRFYPNDPMSLGLATSSDGFTFTKDPNPILWGDSSGFDAFSALAGALYYDSVHWYLYYGGLAAPPTMPSRIISRAIATSPHGPWVRTNDTLLISGSAGEWDDKLIGALQILPTDSGLVMYYGGSDDWHPNAVTMQIGMATSTDGGQSWLKYDDPTTTTPPYAESDPVLKAGPEELSIWGAGVIRHNNLWEMFYAGQTTSYTISICYATSTDGGIHWAKYSENPIFTYLNDPVSSVGVLEIPTVVFVDSIYFLIYDYSIGQAGIGLATANMFPISIISINPTELNFGEVSIDSSATMTFTIINTGNADLVVTNISSNEPAFTVITSTIVPPYSNQEVEVTFTPTEDIQYNGIIEISHNALGSPDTVTVTGNGITGIEEELQPLTFSLEQNYPNPFNPVTMIKYQISELSFVTLKIYDVLGNEIETLVDEYKPAGRYEVEFFVGQDSSPDIASGIYFYQLKATPNGGQAGGYLETKKMILLK